MNNEKLIAALIIGLIVLGVANIAIAAKEPCASYDLSKYAPVHELVTAHMTYPKAALDARIDGYAGVEFQLDATGSPRNIKVVCEKPTGYGIGQAFVDALKQEKFETSGGLDEWHYQPIALGIDKSPASPKH